MPHGVQGAEAPAARLERRIMLTGWLGSRGVRLQVWENQEGS